MSKPSRLLALAALSAFVVVSVWQWQRPAAAQEKEKPKEKAAPAAVTKWEYRIVVMHERQEKAAETELNKLGEEGFEIAFVTSGQTTLVGGFGGPGGGGQPGFGARGALPGHTVHYTLKRAKQ